MKILLTGATGYIGKRLLPILVSKGYHVVCSVRELSRFNPPASIIKKIDVIELDFLNDSSLDKIPNDIDGAYYLMHSMSSFSNYEEHELVSAKNFRKKINSTNVKHVVYLSGIVNEKSLSKHLASRKAVEDELAKGNYHLTTLRASIIIGSGSASFEIIRDLIEKIPIIIAPKWLNTKCQPISIADVLIYLSKVLFNKDCYDLNYDIGGPDILTYKEMLLGYAKARGIKRKIFIIPVMTPKISSYWLYFVTSISFKLASALVNSMKVEVICQKNDLNKLLNTSPIGYQEALKLTFSKIEEDQIASSWKDSFSSGYFNQRISDFINVPTHACFIDIKNCLARDPKRTIEKIWQIGGDTGWYYANFLWKTRGLVDKMFGGVGLRGRRSHHLDIFAGDAIDFWRVLYANKDEGRLLLFAEMKLPGEAWLEFKVVNNILTQTTTFRPKGILGRNYWYLFYPIHSLVLKGMINKLAK